MRRLPVVTFLGALATVPVAGPGLAAELGSLEGPTRWLRSLEDRDESTGQQLVFQAEPPPSLEGVTWQVLGYNDGKQAVTKPVAGTSPTLRFEGGAVTGTTGCNTFRGIYTVSGANLTLSPAATTRKMCMGEGVMEQEQLVLKALQSVSTWSVQDGRLDLRRADGRRAVSARPQAAK